MRVTLSWKSTSFWGGGRLLHWRVRWEKKRESLRRKGNPSSNDGIYSEENLPGIPVVRITAYARKRRKTGEHEERPASWVLAHRGTGTGFNSLENGLQGEGGRGQQKKSVELKDMRNSRGSRMAYAPIRE